MKYFFFFSVVFFWSCKETSEKQETAQKVNEVVVSIKNPSAENSSLPRLFSNGEELFLSWISKKDSLSILNYSKYSDGVWLPSEEIISGTDWFVNWADFPQIAENSGNILTSYLQKSADGTYTYDVKLNLYNDSTKTWKRNFILHNDGTKSEHGFVSIQPYVSNSFFVTWLDGRNTAGGHENHSEHGNSAMNLRGAIVFEDGTIDYDKILDDRVCDCCNTAAAIGSNDELIVVYRDRSEEEVRDISMKRWTRDSNWLPPITIGNDQWKIAGCPVNGPAVDTYESSTAVAWFTGVGDEGKVNVAFSGNYKNPIRVDAGNATGRVDIVMLSETEAAVLWMEPQGEDEVIQLVKVSSNGDNGVPITISKTSRERASGFPQLEKVGDTLFVAWTVTAKESSKIEMASVSLNVL
ncbi:hypothetical protein KXJ69_07010 [Aureisphaera sp. CAU 1614]|uniref:Uncharacterized protein n=1 Tax=Halomarinibacterium sedimenti TaxID=2857106 RepID=A0A9X1FNU1_9FLAO|nr:hypothetical protein [Halomarinibacterium sedimenti]MBW2937852.1 hypothetical protein [Halomarinibacterium sedimenti]